MELAVSQVEKIRVLLPYLSERQRRLFLGAEARALGHGGITAVAAAAGVAVATVSAGVVELEAGAAPSPRVRRFGGGRKRLTEIHPELRQRLLDLVEPDMRGDPMSALRWTTKSLRRLARELTAQGIPVGADTVAALLHAEGFSLQANAKIVEGAQHPDRDAQFRHINDQVKAFQASGDPVVSIDAKKKEQIGPFANRGREWHPTGTPVPVRDHDFPDEELGKVIPYGVYDRATNTGWVNVGTDHDTAAFAVASLRRWWHARGRHDYPHARRLLVTADAGGSNSARSRVFKAELAALALQIGLPINVCHFPPGTSKWNTIEHRLFCHISMNWRGRPLESHDVVVNTIRATTTSTGLRVDADLDTRAYPTGQEIDDTHFDALPITRDAWHGEWNYTLRPEPVIPAPPPPPRQQRPTPAPDRQPTHPTPQPHDQYLPTHPILTHPALTGLTDTAWQDLRARYLPLLQARHDARVRQHRERQRRYRHPDAPPGPATATNRGRGGGRTARHTLTDWLLATVLRYRFGLSYPTLAALFTIKPDMANHWVNQTRTLFLETGYPIEEPTTHLDSLTAIINYAAAAGIDITPALPTETQPQIKDAC